MPWGGSSVRRNMLASAPHSGQCAGGLSAASTMPQMVHFWLWVISPCLPVQAVRHPRAPPGGTPDMSVISAVACLPSRFHGTAPALMQKNFILDTNVLLHDPHAIH